VFLVDGYALIYRAFHAVGKKPLTTTRGENTAIPWGIANFLERLRREHKPEYLGWVHDAGQSNREVLYAGYKATRIALEPDQKADFDRGVRRVAQLLAAQHVPLLEVRGFEADDVIATLALKCAAAGVEAVVVSPDKDLLQLVGPGVRVLNPYHGRPGATTEKWYDESNAHERLGVPPSQVADYLALVGDHSDNVPGVKGIGEKGARELLAQWRSLDNLLAHVDEVVPARTRAALVEHAENARLSKALVTAQTELPVELDLDALAVGAPDVAALRALYVELEFAGLARALPDTSAAETGIRSAYAVVDTAEALARLVDAARQRGRIAVRLETEQEPGAPPVVAPLRASLISLAIALGPGEAFYLPIGHRRPGGQSELDLGGPPTPGVANLPGLTDPRLEPLVALIEDAAVKKVMHNAKYDSLVLRRAGVQLRGLAFDTMLASYLLNPSRRSHELDTLTFELLDHTLISRSAVSGKGRKESPLAELSVESARDYACDAVDYTARLHTLFAPRLEEEHLTGLLNDLEIPLVGVLADMEWTGVAIDREWFDSLKVRFKGERQAVERRIWDEAGEEFNLNSTARLREILFGKLAMPVKKRTATGPSTDATVLQELADEGHTLPLLLMEYRELAKLESTYLDALPALVNPRTGRLHTSYSQTVAATGRLSSSDPNLQNIPIRTELGRDIRRGFVPHPGWKFLAADYSQIELRLLAHLSSDPAFLHAFRTGSDIHRQTAAAIFGVDAGAVTKEMRSRAKTINFATIYGQGAFALSRQLKIELEEAKSFIATYFERFAGVRRYLDQCVDQARERGYAETILGRRRAVPELRDSNFNVRAFGERVAQNSPIQGSAADLIKRAMLRAASSLYNEGMASVMLLQVHDELVFEGPPEELDALHRVVVDAMEGAATLDVPLVVDVGIGSNWLDTKAH
jgi:DNA polymerase-1